MAMAHGHDASAVQAAALRLEELNRKELQRRGASI